jgi:hypothetical protein
MSISCGSCTPSPKSWTATIAGGLACSACQWPSHLKTYDGSLDGTSWTLRKASPFTASICTYTFLASTGPMTQYSWPGAGCTGSPTQNQTFGMIIQYPNPFGNFAFRAGTVTTGFSSPNNEYFRAEVPFGADCTSTRTLTNAMPACNLSQFNGYVGGSVVLTPNF